VRGISRLHQRERQDLEGEVRSDNDILNAFSSGVRDIRVFGRGVRNIRVFDGVGRSKDGSESCES